jgi:hypothetical protein
VIGLGVTGELHHQPLLGLLDASHQGSAPQLQLELGGHLDQRLLDPLDPLEPAIDLLEPQLSPLLDLSQLVSQLVACYRSRPIRFVCHDYTVHLIEGNRFRPVDTPTDGPAVPAVVKRRAMTLRCFCRCAAAQDKLASMRGDIPAGTARSLPANAAVISRSYGIECPTDGRTLEMPVASEFRTLP